jgi:hypothetical protein
MKTVLTALVCALSALVLVAAAPAADIGVTDDGAKFTDDPDAFYSRIESLGLKQNTITVSFDPTVPDAIRDEFRVQAAIEAAARHKIKIVFAVGTGRARAITGNSFGAAQYIAFLRRLVERYPTVEQYIVGNEGNVWRFWQPQYTRTCRPIAAAVYERLLAASYDALKDANPKIRVVGVGLSPRGNDNCHARSNISTSPVHYLAHMGAAYRSSGRTKPLMDALSFHPYPQSNSDSLAVGYRYPNAGVVNLDRIKQAFWDAFNDTAQPTFVEGLPLPPSPFDAPEPGLEPRHATFVLDEVGWQAKEPRRYSSAYRGRENVRLVSEGKQAVIYAQIVHLANCDPAVESLNFFHLDDESDRDRFQSGLFRADLSARPSAFTVRDAIAADGGECSGRLSFWRHANGVVGAHAVFRVAPSAGSWAFGALAEEEANFHAGVFRVSDDLDRDAIMRSLASKRQAPRLVLSARGFLMPYRQLVFRLGARLAPGRYVYGVRLVARYNPERATLIVSRPFSL